MQNQLLTTWHADRLIAGLKLKLKKQNCAFGTMTELTEARLCAHQIKSYWLTLLTFLGNAKHVCVRAYPACTGQGQLAAMATPVHAYEKEGK